MSKIVIHGFLVLLVASVPRAFAQPVPDHLECYKIKDPQARMAYTADLEGLTPETGCRVKVPAKIVCVPTPKTVTSSPPPPGGGATGVPNTFLCYSVKCPKNIPPTFDVQDQFGSRTVVPRQSKLLCAPAVRPEPTTTTTTLCPGSQTLCAGICIDTQTDARNCGTCGNDCDAVCTGNVTSTACAGGICTVASCAVNQYNTDGICSNGCECAGTGTGGSSCGASANIGTINVGQLTSRSGNLPDGSTHWYQITFTPGGSHTLSLTTNPGAAYQFDVLSNCSTAVCLDATTCDPGPGTYQVGVKASAGVCASYAVTFQN